MRVPARGLSFARAPPHPTGMSFSYIRLSEPELDVSLVVPVRDESESVGLLAEEIGRALGTGAWEWECVWVDDGSRDGTLRLLEQLHSNDPRHRYVRLDGPHGQSAALAAGLSRTRGAVLVTLDGDGQMDPADIPGLLRTLEERGADAVLGWRRGRRDRLVKRLASRIANAFRNRLTGEEVRDVGCSLRAFRRECARGLLVFRGMHRFLPTLLRLNGARTVVEVPVSHRPRRHGRSKYGIRDRLWVGIGDTLAVRWMGRRSVRPKLKGESPAPGDQGSKSPVPEAGPASGGPPPGRRRS
ncbi:MAG: glycosyltransferase family 2 protein [Gemmatimonadota bacterium]